MVAQAEITGDHKYDMEIAMLRHSPYMDYPSHVHLETWAHCNAGCGFCPYPQLDRKGTRMSDELIDKVLTDLEDMPLALPFQLSPFKVSEPFLDKRMLPLLVRVNDRLPNATITLTTNASPLTEEKLQRLSQIQNIKYLWISFNDHRERQYEETMKLPYARTIERLDLIHEWAEHGRLPFRICLSRVGDRTRDDDEFTVWANRYYPEFSTYIFPRSSWLGQTDAETGSVPNIGCKRWFELSITATGTVAHCCMDGQAKWPIGDVSRDHALEIYNNPEYRALRERTVSRLHAAPCNQCTFE